MTRQGIRDEDHKPTTVAPQDFYQKRQLSKMKALAADRAALPMAAYEAAVVEAVQNHPAIVIAGDTGELH